MVFVAPKITKNITTPLSCVVAGEPLTVNGYG